jgi:hypothetical protein
VRKCWLLFAALSTCVVTASAQQIVRVPRHIWSGLTQTERDLVQRESVIDVAESTSFGLVIDNQGADESRPTNASGSYLGQAVGSATYIDRSFGSGNYSARGHLAATLLGGLLGATLDQPAVRQFHFRYAVRMGDGNVSYHDVMSSDAFRHPTGVCVLLPGVTLAPDQQLCHQSLASFRSAHLSQTNSPVLTPPSPVLPRETPNVIPPNDSVTSTRLVNCKVTALPAVRTTPEKCKQVNGVELND